MKNKRLLILLLLIIFVGLFFYLNKNQNQKERTQISPTPSIVATKTIMDAPKNQIEEYYQVYQNPAVIFLRKALNAYLADDSTGVNISMAAVQPDTREGIITGLSSFSKDYYKSKFVVVTIENSISGGKDIQILFQEKPDRIFYAWVYQLADGNYELRGFNSKEDFDKEESKEAFKKVIEYYKPLLFDKTHAL